MTGFVKLAMVTGCALLSWGVLWVLYQVTCLWPVVGWSVSTGLGGFAVGVLVSGDVVRARVEPVQERKDTAIEAVFGTAFELQERELRDSGEHPEVEPEPRRYPARCGCGQPAVGFDEDGPYCQRCAPSAVIDAEGNRWTLPRTVPDAWRPAAKGRWLS